MDFEKIASKVAERHYSAMPNAETDKSYRLRMIEILKIQIIDECKKAQALQLLQPDVSTSVCVCKVCDKPFGDTLSLWEHFYHNHIKQTEC